MRIQAFVGHYPSPYKPYYDTQFVEFLRAGHDLRIMAAPVLDDTLNEKVVRHGLSQRTQYYPESGRHAGARVIGRLIRRPVKATRYLRGAGESRIRRGAVELLSLLALPDAAPDVAIVHELSVGLRFHRLREWYGEVPVGMYYHGGEVASVRPHRSEFVAQVFDHFDVVFTNTAFSRQHAIDRGCPPEKVVVLPVGFDLADYRPPPNRCYRRDGTLQLLSAGRMSEEKGFDYALQALRIVVESGRRNIRYSFTGDGYVREPLEEYVKQHGLEPYVRFLGRLTTDQVITSMGNTDALVLSSVTVGNWTENQACAVQEAMLMKALVITTQTGGVPESIPPAMKRFSSPERDAAGLARAIMDVYDLTDEQFAALGREGRNFVESGYDIRDLNRALLARLMR